MDDSFAVISIGYGHTHPFFKFKKIFLYRDFCARRKREALALGHIRLKKSKLTRLVGLDGFHSPWTVLTGRKHKAPRQAMACATHLQFPGGTVQGAPDEELSALDGLCAMPDKPV